MSLAVSKYPSRARECGSLDRFAPEETAGPHTDLIAMETENNECSRAPTKDAVGPIVVSEIECWWSSERGREKARAQR